MIVECQHCKTSFRIDDEKIPAAGIKFRCAKCRNTFIVRRPAVATTDAPGSGGAAATTTKQLFKAELQRPDPVSGPPGSSPKANVDLDDQTVRVEPPRFEPQLSGGGFADPPVKRVDNDVTVNPLDSPVSKEVPADPFAWVRETAQQTKASGAMHRSATAAELGALPAPPVLDDDPLSAPMPPVEWSGDRPLPSKGLKRRFPGDTMSFLDAITPGAGLVDPPSTPDPLQAEPSAFDDSLLDPFKALPSTSAETQPPLPSTQTGPTSPIAPPSYPSQSGLAAPAASHATPWAQPGAAPAPQVDPFHAPSQPGGHAAAGYSPAPAYPSGAYQAPSGPPGQLGSPGLPPAPAYPSGAYQAPSAPPGQLASPGLPPAPSYQSGAYQAPSAPPGLLGSPGLPPAPPYPSGAYQAPSAPPGMMAPQSAPPGAPQVADGGYVHLQPAPISLPPVPTAQVPGAPASTPPSPPPQRSIEFELDLGYSGASPDLGTTSPSIDDATDEKTLNVDGNLNFDEEPSLGMESGLELDTKSSRESDDPFADLALSVPSKSQRSTAPKGPPTETGFDYAGDGSDATRLRAVDDQLLEMLKTRNEGKSTSSARQPSKTNLGPPSIATRALASESSSRVGRVASAALSLTIVLALLIGLFFLRGGSLDRLSPSAVVDVLFSETTASTSGEFEAREITVTSYPVTEERRVVVVMGEVENRGDSTMPAVVVSGELVDDQGNTVESRKVYAGAVVSPFDLEAELDPAVISALVEQRVATAGETLQPGGRWPFSLVFNGRREGLQGGRVTLQIRPADAPGGRTTTSPPKAAPKTGSKKKVAQPGEG